MRLFSVTIAVLAAAGSALAQDPFNTALHFDGSDDYVEIGDHPALNPTNALTIEVRVRSDNYDRGDWQEFVFKGGNDAGNDEPRQYYIRPQAGTGRVQFKLNGPNDVTYTADAEEPLTNGVCYHLAGTFDGNVMRLYINGVLIDNEYPPGSFSIVQSDEPLVFGRLGSVSAEYYDGDLYEIRLWNRARTQAQIIATMNDTLASAYYSSNDSGLVGYWRCDEGSGNTVFDLSVNNNHGSRNGPAYVPVGVCLALANPYAGQLMIAGRRDTIRWISSEIDSLRIEFSDDGGATYYFVATGVSADSHQYVWEVPDALSTRCLIKLTDIDNEDQTAVSDTFKVKGYRLTRFWPNGDYEPFELGLHGWSFANTEVNMWPNGWWSQFNYQSGIDPYTGQLYPNELPFAVAQASDFPDWPLFVRGFWVDQCYWNASEAVYNQVALEKWANMKKIWSGSCLGFALSCFLAFEDKEAFLGAFPEMPDFPSLYAVEVGDSVRKVINQLGFHWRGKQHQQYANQQETLEPRETLREILDMMLSDAGSDMGGGADIRHLVFRNNAQSSAHAVNPYRVWFDPDLPGIYEVFVYDNNYPNDTTKRVFIDSTSNFWNYTSYSWSGTSGLYLMDPVVTYLEPPILMGVPAMNLPPVSNPSGAAYIEFNNTPEASLIITDAGGNTIGFADSATFNNLGDGVPIIPITSVYQPPIGYYVPDGSYTIEIGQFTDSMAYLSVVSDTLFYGYRRFDANPDQSDNLSYGTGFGISNPDAQTKSIQLTTIVIEPNNEKVFFVNDVELIQNDSLHMNVLTRNDLDLANYGSAASYDLRLKFLSAQGQSLFEHGDIAIVGHSTHQIAPDWANLGIVTIYIDLENNGTIDDTMYVANTVDVEDQGYHGIPTEYYLAQNYPNPFNPMTTIQYALQEQAYVTLKIYNILGQEVASLVNEMQEAGYIEVGWDASGVTSGVYFYRIEAHSPSTNRIFVSTKKMLLLR